MFIRENKRFNIYASVTIDGVTYPNFTSPELRTQLGITEIPDPATPDDYTDETYYRTEQDTEPYVVYTKKSQEQLEELAAQKEAQRVDSLWQAATAYEQSFIANMAIGLLTMGLMLQKPKALAISEWSSDLWNGPDGYYARKSNGSTNCDYSNIGPMPYSIPELSAEVLG